MRPDGFAERPGDLNQGHCAGERPEGPRAGASWLEGCPGNWKDRTSDGRAGRGRTPVARSGARQGVGSNDFLKGRKSHCLGSRRSKLEGLRKGHPLQGLRAKRGEGGLSLLQKQGGIGRCTEVGLNIDGIQASPRRTRPSVIPLTCEVWPPASRAALLGTLPLGCPGRRDRRSESPVLGQAWLQAAAVLDPHPGSRPGAATKEYSTQEVTENFRKSGTFSLSTFARASAGCFSV